MENSRCTYILLANAEAMALYRDSIDALMESDNCDFMVHRFNRGIPQVALDRELEEWEVSMSIDEMQYKRLYHNLCSKIRRRFSKSK